MSRECDGPVQVYDEQLRKARKEHKCDACEERIRAGDTYNYSTIIYDGSVEHIKRCLRCQKIHLHLRDVSSTDDDYLWPDERLNCGEEYTSHWGKPPPDDIAALAFALPGEVKP